MISYDQSEWTYRLFTDDVVEFSGYGEWFRLDRANIETAIANVKSERHIYASQAAYDHQLAIYTGALWFLDSQSPKGETPMDADRFTLNIGCHRRTLTSRDADIPRSFDTYEKAYADYLETRAFWNRHGYVVWFAEIVAPNGEKTQLESNPYY